MKRLLLCLTSGLLIPAAVFCQCAVAITIDDVPNTRKYSDDNYRQVLLEAIDSMKIPVTVFINEGLLTATGQPEKNLFSLERWVKSGNVTPGTHTYSHPGYSEYGYEKFRADYLRGMTVTSVLADKYGKPLKYFRFPYNDLGTDSVQHAMAAMMVSEAGNVSAPFTVSSSDYAFNAFYDYYLKNGEKQKASEIADRYIRTTIEYFSFMDSLSLSMYRRHMNQVYLCHDNAINADNLPRLISRLRTMGYSFITLDEALTDSVYRQEDTYYFKWGVSWFYRWMRDNDQRKALMRREPYMQDIEEGFENIEKKGSPNTM